MAANAEDIRSAGRPAAQVRIANWAATPRPKLGPLGAELPLDAEESAIVDTLRPSLRGRCVYSACSSIA